MTEYLLDGCPSAIYMFVFKVKGRTEKSAIKNSLPTVKRCEDFADSFHIFCSCDHVGLIDGELEIRATFNIKEPQDSILIKVSALFCFAASLKLTLVNQFFYAE